MDDNSHPHPSHFSTGQPRGAFAATQCLLGTPRSQGALLGGGGLGFRKWSFTGRDPMGVW